LAVPPGLRRDRCENIREKQAYSGWPGDVRFCHFGDELGRTLGTKWRLWSGSGGGVFGGALRWRVAANGVEMGTVRGVGGSLLFQSGRPIST
jgi:hypothetical protein